MKKGFFKNMQLHFIKIYALSNLRSWVFPGSAVDGTPLQKEKSFDRWGIIILYSSQQLTKERMWVNKTAESKQKI